MFVDLIGIQSARASTVAKTRHPARLIRRTHESPIPLEHPLITTVFCDVGISTFDRERISIQMFAGRKECRNSNFAMKIKKPEPIVVPA